MERKYEFRYYYGEEAEQFSFYKIPKLLITHEYFRDLSNDAKILYGLLLDRMSLSVKNKWFDEENRADEKPSKAKRRVFHPSID